MTAAQAVRFPGPGERGYVPPEDREFIHAANNVKMGIVRKLMDAQSPQDVYNGVLVYQILDLHVHGVCGSVSTDPWEMLKENKGCFSGSIRRRCVELGVI